MPKPLRRISVRTHHFNSSTDAALEQLAQIAAERGVELVAPAGEATKHERLAALGYQVRADDGDDADAVLAFGGDGTILRSLGRNLTSGVPTLGVNFGNVGFLASLAPDDWQTELDDIIRGRYIIVDLMTVSVRVGERTYVGVNDVVLSRVAPRHVLQLDYAIAGVRVGSLACDGVIVATPAGSTAYNLSCAGPIIEWDADVLVLNGIAPHSLAFRPVILRPTREIRVVNTSPTQLADIAVDGESVGQMRRGDEVVIAAGHSRARLMMALSSSFYRNVQRKLFESQDPRCDAR